MATADASVIEVLSSPDASLRRLLVRDGSGHAVEAIECTAARAEALPWGGIFAAYDRREGRVLLGPVLARRLTDLRPPPLVTLGLVRWLLQDLERLHGAGGAHGAIHPDGVGFDATGLFQVRPSFAFAQPVAATPQMQDVAAVGAVLAALTSVAGLEGAGVARAKLWWNGLGIDGGRIGFPDSRAARQALSAAVGRRDLDADLASFLARVAGRLPPPAVAFRVRPVAATRVGVGPDGVSAERMAEARAILDTELSDFRLQRFERSQTRVGEERERITTRRAAAAALRAAPMVAGTMVEGGADGPLRIVLDPRRAQAARTDQESLLGRGDGVFRVKVGVTEDGALEALDAEPDEHARVIALSEDSGMETGEPERRYSMDEVPLVAEADAGGAPNDSDDDPTMEGESLGTLTDVEPLDGESMVVPPAIAGRRESEDRLSSEIRNFRDDMERRREDEQARREETERQRAEEEAHRAQRREVERAVMRVEVERVAARRLAEHRAEAARVEAERIEAQRIEAERVEAERIEAERVEAERIEAERVEAERIEAERVEAERIEAERIEAERVEAERIEAERVEAERVEAERIEAERIKAERVEAERIEAERIEAERVEAERIEAERIEAERVEAERIEAERVEAERIEAERVEVERKPPATPEQAEVARLDTARESARVAVAAHESQKRPQPEDDPATSPGERRRSRGDDDDISLEGERGLPASGRWEGAMGISGRPDREQELGPGKWTEQGRSAEELRRNLPTGPTRPMEMEDPPARAPIVPILVFAAVLVLAVVAWLVFR